MVGAVDTRHQGGRGWVPFTGGPGPCVASTDVMADGLGIDAVDHQEALFVFFKKVDLGPCGTDGVLGRSICYVAVERAASQSGGIPDPRGCGLNFLAEEMGVIYVGVGIAMDAGIPATTGIES